MTMNSKAGTSLQMFPPCCSCLFLLFGLLLSFPLGIFPLPLFALKKSPYLRNQSTDPGSCLMAEYPALFQTVCAIKPPNLSAASICIFMVA